LKGHSKMRRTRKTNLVCRTGVIYFTYFRQTKAKTRRAWSARGRARKNTQCIEYFQSDWVWKLKILQRMYELISTLITTHTWQSKTAKLNFAVFECQFFSEYYDQRATYFTVTKFDKLYQVFISSFLVWCFFCIKVKKLWRQQRSLNRKRKYLFISQNNVVQPVWRPIWIFSYILHIKIPNVVVIFKSLSC